MCGILLCLGHAEGCATIGAKVIDRSRRIRHRGPDWSGHYTSGGNTICHERLAIVDPENGAQPLKNGDKSLILAVNGEIYNHKDLRKELKNPSKFQTDSDCEIIWHLYEEGGVENVCHRLNGIWAFVLLDEKKGTFLIGRDHCGIIPLYWGRDVDGALWIASEMKALHDVCKTFEDFPPGHYYDSTAGVVKKWYEPAWHDEKYMPTKPVDLVELREQLTASVKRQLMADVPYGVLLSGGLDSSLTSAIAMKLIKEENPDAVLHSFSIGLEGSPDLAAAQKVADVIGTEHHGYTFTIEEGLNAYRHVIYHLETYDTTTIRAATPMYLLSRKIASMGIKMVLSGEGADEIFGGYLYFHRCPGTTDMQSELVRKVKGLYKFDCLRANKSTSAWGVEARVPFLDKEFLDYAMNDIRPEDKMCGYKAEPANRVEKWALREAFKDGYLPDEVLWRQKEQFSDGVGYSWIDTIKAKAAERISDEQLANAKYRFPHNPPASKESYYIRETFESFYPEPSAAASVPGGPSVACSSSAAVLWDASFTKFADCSGRSVGVHASAYDDKHKEEAAAKGNVQVTSTEEAANTDLGFCKTIALKTTKLV